MACCRKHKHTNKIGTHTNTHIRLHNHSCILSLALFGSFCVPHTHKITHILTGSRLCCPLVVFFFKWELQPVEFTLKEVHLTWMLMKPPLCVCVCVCSCCVDKVKPLHSENIFAGWEQVLAPSRLSSVGVDQLCSCWKRLLTLLSKERCHRLRVWIYIFLGIHVQTQTSSNSLLSVCHSLIMYILCLSQRTSLLSKTIFRMTLRAQHTTAL